MPSGGEGRRAADDGGVANQSAAAVMMKRRTWQGWGMQAMTPLILVPVRRLRVFVDSVVSERLCDGAGGVDEQEKRARAKIDFPPSAFGPSKIFILGNERRQKKRNEKIANEVGKFLPFF